MPGDKLGCRRSKSFSLHGCMLIYVSKMSVSYDQDTNEIEVYRAKLLSHPKGGKNQQIGSNNVNNLICELCKT